jgi:hypothetical protein
MEGRICQRLGFQLGYIKGYLCSPRFVSCSALQSSFSAEPSQVTQHTLKEFIAIQMPSSSSNRIAIWHLRGCIEAISSPKVNRIMDGFQQWFELSIDTIATIAIEHISREEVNLLDNEAKSNIFFNAIIHPSFESIFSHIEAFQTIQLEQPNVDIAESVPCYQLQRNILQDLERWERAMPFLTTALTLTRVQPIRPTIARYLSGLLETTQMPDFEETLHEDDLPWYLFALSPAFHRAVRRISLAQDTFMSADEFKTCVKTGDWTCLEKIELFQ